MNVVFQRGQFGVVVFVIEVAQELRFRKFIARGAIAADAHAEDARAAAFALRLLHGIEDDFAAAIEVAISVELGVGQRVLRADIFAAAALEHEAHSHIRFAGLMKMKGRRAGADVGAIVFAGQ